MSKMIDGSVLRDVFTLKYHKINDKIYIKKSCA